MSEALRSEGSRGPAAWNGPARSPSVHGVGPTRPAPHFARTAGTR